MEKNIVVTGSLGMDYIMDFPGRFSDRIMPEKIHQISLSLLVPKFVKLFGGTAGNISYTLKLLRANPLILSSAGDDFASYRKFLRSKHLDVSNIALHKDLPTGAYFVITDKENNQIGAFSTGAMKYDSTLRIQKVKSDFSFVAITPTTPKAMLSYVLECRKFKYPYLFDPAFQIGSFKPKELLLGISGCQILIGNDYEISLIRRTLQCSHQDLLKRTPILITTLGAKGSLIESKGQKIKISSVKVSKVIDPTGAGDAYRGGFLAGYVRGWSLKTCGQMASLAAGFCVEQYGTMNHHYSRLKFQKRYRENFNEVIDLDN